MAFDMNDKELKKIVREFSKGIINNQPNMKCFMVCWPLYTYLDFLHVKTKLVEGELDQEDGTWQHFWLELPDKRIIDPTSHQFKTPAGKRMTAYYVGPKPEWYKKLKT